VFPDHAYPFATLLNVHIRDVPPGVRADALVVATGC
jgi:hypothetical protein